MATVSFAFLDQGFDISATGNVAFSGYDGYTYSYTTTSGHDWEFVGVGLTDDGTVPTGGTLSALELDLDNDSFSQPEVNITGLSLAATALAVNVGTAAEQRDKFWSVALGGADTINFTMSNYDVDLLFAGDGADINDGAVHIGAADSFVDGGTALTGSTLLLGDYNNIVSGSAVGGNDTFSVGAFVLSGDFNALSTGTTGVGGDDLIRPVRLADTGNFFGAFFLVGDAVSASGTLIGGDDVIDLRLVDMTGVTELPALFGETWTAGGASIVIAGNDTIHGSSHADLIYGDVGSAPAYIEGGKDRLFGYAGNDSIIGNEGRDQLYGGDDDDTLNGGIDGDIIDGGNGNDSMVGDTGNDSMTGGDGNDTLLGGSGSDTIDGGVGDDAADAAAGADVMTGGTGKDSLFGGTGNDSITGDAGNDTLQGGDNNDTMLGGAGFDLLLGGNDNDYLDGGASNDILFGNAGVDTFNFATGGGTDTIRDFVAGAGANDFIRLEGFGAAFDTFAEVMAAATDNGTDTTINFGGGNILIIQNVTVAQFNADDFLFG